MKLYFTLSKNRSQTLAPAEAFPNHVAPSKSFSLHQSRKSFMSRRPFDTFRYRALLLLFGVGFSATAWTQQSPVYSRSAAIDQANSRAEHEAEQMVSLSADRILYILRDEPGLLLQVKKALVRKAFEQGRILDPMDLTDEALFRLIREDDSVRIIATREIVDRSYVRARPTREELARNLPCRQPMPATNETLAKQPDQSSPDLKRIPSQEEVYWLKHDSDLDCYLTQYLPYGLPQTLYGQPLNTQTPSQQQYPTLQNPQQQYPQQQYPQQQSPQQQYPPFQTPPQGSSPDYRRQLQLTQTQPSQGYFGMDSDQSEMTSIRPDELPAILNTGQTGGLSGSSRNGIAAGGTGSSSLTVPPALGSSIESLLGSQSGASGFPQEARLENRTGLPLQQY